MRISCDNIIIHKYFRHHYHLKNCDPYYQYCLMYFNTHEDNPYYDSYHARSYLWLIVMVVGQRGIRILYFVGS